MISRLFSSKINSITGAAILLGAASFLSRIMGIVRDRIFAHQFGASDVLDAYYSAFRIPDLIYNLLIVGALSAGFIPVFAKLWIEDKPKAWRLTNNVINILGISLIIICGLFFLFTPKITPYLVPGFAGEKMQITILLTRIMFISPILLGISSAISGTLQAVKSFFLYAIAPLFYNVGIIAGAIFFVPMWGNAGLAYGVILGAFLHLAIQVPALLGQGYRYKFVFAPKEKEIKKIGRLMVPRMLGMATSQTNFIVVTLLGSTLASGSIAIFNFANNLGLAPVGIIGISFAVAAFPALSQLLAENKKLEMIEHFTSTVRQIIFFIVPITICFLLLRAQIVRVVLGSGEFDWSATILTANALAVFSLSLFAQCLIPLFARAYYALEDTWTPFIISLISTLLNIILCLVLKDATGITGFEKGFGVIGLAFAFSISMVVQLALLWVMLRQKLGTLHELPLLHFLYKISIASIVMATTIQALKTPLASVVDMQRFWGILVQGGVSATAGTILFALCAYLLGIEEMLQLYQSLRKKWLKIPPQEIQNIDENIPS